MSGTRTPQANVGESLKKVEELDVGALVVSTATNIVKKRPVTVSLWVLGLLLAAFAKGFAVDETKRESYMMTLSHAEEVGSEELVKAMRSMGVAESKYRNLKGWFSCDRRCNEALDRYNMAQADVNRIMNKREMIINEARHEVGIWSVFGVQDVRNAFWKAWQSGKDFAARWTMMDAFFMMMPGRREESAVSMILKLVMQYIINLTMGLIGGFCFFIYNVYTLVQSYGEPFLSGLAFFLLVLVAGCATIGTYLFAIYGTVAGGGIYLMKQAAKQAAVEGGRPGGRPRPVQYQQQGFGGGRPGGRQYGHND